MDRSSDPALLRPPPIAWGIVASLASIKLALHLATNHAYGFHRDELYYLVCGRHLAWGYVDHPPLTPLLARLVEMAVGSSVTGLRFAPAACGALMVVLAALIAREMGGRTWAQGLAALTVLLSPIYLLTNNLFQTVTFDQVAWVACSLLVVRILRTGQGPWWLAVGAAAGIGLLAKYTMLVFGVGLVVGLVLTRHRQHFKSRWLWLGGAAAALIVLPNVIWQIRHGWPTLTFMANNSARAAAEFPLPAFLALQPVFIGVASVPLFLAGLAFLFGRQGAPFRPIGWLAVSVLVVFAAAGGKPYYPAPIYPVVLAAGAVAIEALAARRHWQTLRYVIPLLLVLGNAPAIGIMLPLVSRETYAAHQDAWPHQEFAETIGWESLAADVARAFDALPAPERARAGLYADAYGEAAALDVLGARLGLPRATSGHNSYYLWGPPDTDVVVAVAGSRASLGRIFEDVEEVSPVASVSGVRNEASTKSIFICRRPRLPWPELWPLLKGFV